MADAVGGPVCVAGSRAQEGLHMRVHAWRRFLAIAMVAGLVLAALEHVPTVGEHVQIQGVTFRVTAMDHLRIERLEITLPPTPNDQSSSAAETAA